MISARSLFEGSYNWRIKRVLDTTIHELLERLVLGRLERAYWILNGAVVGRVGTIASADMSVDDAARVIVYGVLYPLPRDIEDRCVVLRILARSRGEQEYRVVDAVCRTAERVFWFTEEPDGRPILNMDTWRSLFSLLASHKMPVGVDPERELDAVLGEYESLVAEDRLEGITPYRLTYWLSLAYPEYYIPFSGSYCLYVAPEETGRCLKAREDPERLGKFKEYYVRLLHTVWGLPFYHPPSRLGRWGGSNNLLRLHFLTRAYMRYTESTLIAP